MKFTEKPIHQLEAQVALYAEQHPIPSHGFRGDALLGQIATRSVSHLLPEIILHEDISFHARPLEDGTLEPLFDKAEYIELIRNTSKHERETVAAMFASFDTIRSQIEEMQLEPNIGYKPMRATPYSRPDFLGAGRDNSAYEKQLVINGTEIDAVILVPRTIDFSPKSKLNERVIALSKVAGQPGFEQGIAVSLKPVLLVTQKAPGTSINELDLNALRAIPPKHWQALADNVEAVGGRVGLDANPDNYLYDTEHGFTVIDFGRPHYGIKNAAQANFYTIESLNRRYGSF